VTARNGDISLTLPDTWRGADVSDGVEGKGSEMFPDDASAAARLEQRLNVLPRAVVIFGVEPPSPGAIDFADNVILLSDPTVPGSMSLEEAGPAEARGLKRVATVTDQGLVDLGALEAYRIVYEGSGFSGAAYVVKGADDTWVLTYTFGASGADVDLADASAATFDAP